MDEPKAVDPSVPYNAMVTCAERTFITTVGEALSRNKDDVNGNKALRGELLAAQREYRSRSRYAYDLLGKVADKALLEML